MFSLVFWLLMCLGGSKTCVFIGVLARREHWGSKTLCFSKVFWLLGGRGGSIVFTVFFVSLIALEAPKPLCFQRCSGSQKFCVFHRLLDPRGVWELQKSMLSQVFGLLGWPGGLQTLSFHKYPGSSGALGLQNPMSKMFWLLGCSGGSQILCFTSVRAPQVTSGTPKPNVFISFFLAARGTWGLQNHAFSSILWLLRGPGRS